MTEAQWKIVDAIPGWLTRPEAELLFNLVANHPEITSSVVEVGSYQGRSTVALAYGMATRKVRRPVVAVDPHIGSPDMQKGRKYHDPLVSDGAAGINTLAAFLQNIQGAGVEWIEPKVCTSEELLKHSYVPADIVFIDANHEYEEVKKDFESWASMVQPGGLIAFHDYTKCKGVKRAVDEIVSLGVWAFKYRVDSLTKSVSYFPAVG